MSSKGVRARPKPTESEIAELIRTAKGETAADVVIAGANLVNVYTGRIEPNTCLAAKGEWIVHVGPWRRDLVGTGTLLIQARGRYLLPGYIDAHTHLDSIFTCHHYATHALKSGNTTAVTEAAMIAGAAGAEGLWGFVDEARGAAMRIFFLSPPLTPPFPEYETSAGLDRGHFERLLTEDDCLGVGETYWVRPVDLDQRALLNFASAHRLNKTIEGHAAGARDEKLSAYLAAGVSSCHEAISFDDGFERLRAGLAVMIREGYVRQEMEAVLPGLLDYDHSRVMLVTDLASPEEMITQGTMRPLLRKAVSLGADPVDAVKMVTLNPATYFGLDRILGGLAPGRLADAVLVGDLYDFEATTVMLGGRVAAEAGRLTFEVEGGEVRGTSTISL